MRSCERTARGRDSMMSVRVRPASELPESTSAMSSSSPLELKRTCEPAALLQRFEQLLCMKAAVLCAVLRQIETDRQTDRQKT
eukprot:742531-Rhodomonas_salina.2